MRDRKKHMDVRSSRPRGVLRLASCISVILLYSLLSPLCYAHTKPHVVSGAPPGPGPVAPAGLAGPADPAGPVRPVGPVGPPGPPGPPDDGPHNQLINSPPIPAPLPRSETPGATPENRPSHGPPVEAPSPTSSPPSSAPSRSGLTSGAKAGLGLISVAGLLQVVVFFFLMARRRQLLRDLNDPGDWSPARDL